MIVMNTLRFETAPGESFGGGITTGSGGTACITLGDGGTSMIGSEEDNGW